MNVCYMLQAAIENQSNPTIVNTKPTVNRLLLRIRQKRITQKNLYIILYITFYNNKINGCASLLFGIFTESTKNLSNCNVLKNTIFNPQVLSFRLSDGSVCNGGLLIETGACLAPQWGLQDTNLKRYFLIE